MIKILFVGGSLDKQVKWFNPLEDKISHVFIGQITAMTVEPYVLIRTKNWKFEKIYVLASEWVKQDTNLRKVAFLKKITEIY